MLGGMCVTADFTLIKLLVFTCDKEKGAISTYLLNLNDKDISKVKMRE